MAKLGATNISIMDVRNILGYPSTDLGTLCTCNNINPWSKWKPIHCANTLTLNNELLKRNKYGIEILEANNPGALVNLIKQNNNSGYKYDKPRGGSFSPYRLGDFRNYYHNALLPVSAFYKDGDEIHIGGITSSNHGSYEAIIEGMKLPDLEPEESDYISQGMLYDYLDYSGNKIPLKKGVYFTDGTNDCWYSGKAYYWTTEFQRFSGKQVEAYEFYTNATRTPNDLWVADAKDRFYALPEPYHTISVDKKVPAGSRKVLVICHPELSTDRRSVSYTLQFSAVGEVYRGGTISNIHIRIAKDLKGINMIDTKKITDSLTIQDETESLTYTGTLRNLNGETSMYVLVYYDNAIQWTGVPSMEVDPQA